MIKDIYVIKNCLNNKVYVGQSVDYKTRFRKHKEEARRNNYSYKSELYDAMNELGSENFYVEVIEHSVKNPDEREEFWIKKLNALYPNGYNLSTGGTRYPNLKGTLNYRAAIKDEKVLDSIYDMLENSDLSLTQISKKSKVSFSVVQRINAGTVYARKGYSYPIRHFELTKEKLDRLTYDLKYTNIPYKNLAELYGISHEQVKTINYGLSWHRDYIIYPIRKMCFSASNELYTQIQKDLISTKLTSKEIAEKYECKEATVWRVNYGRTAHCDELQYPLRKFCDKLSSEDVYNIHILLLESDMSINEIASKYNISSETIKRLNSGKTKKYRDNRFTYPLRK